MLTLVIEAADRTRSQEPALATMRPSWAEQSLANTSYEQDMRPQCSTVLMLLNLSTELVSTSLEHYNYNISSKNFTKRTLAKQGEVEINCSTNGLDQSDFYVAGLSIEIRDLDKRFIHHFLLVS